MLFRPAPDTVLRLLRATLLLAACSLGGALDALGNEALCAARATDFAEEEEVFAKEAALVCSAQPSRRGALRPRAVLQIPLATRISRPARIRARHTVSHAAELLTGAGIFQHR